MILVAAPKPRHAGVYLARRSQCQAAELAELIQSAFVFRAVCRRRAGDHVSERPFESLVGERDRLLEGGSESSNVLDCTRAGDENRTRVLSLGSLVERSEQ